MDFIAAVTFLCVYFIRPQDWVPGMSGFNIVMPIMAFGFLGLITKSESLLANGWRSILRTPHDWLVYIYSLYILFTAPVFSEAFSELLPLIGFYFLTTQAITSYGHLWRYMKAWMWCLVAIAFLAVGSLFGLDFTGARAVTEQNQGRLCLNTWMLDNPNALGHTEIVALPLLYFGLFWHQSVLRKLLALAFAGLALLCVYYTESKGSYISGLVALTGGLVFGRSKRSQVFLLSLVLLLSGTLLSALPRMTDMSSLKSDEGVMGRVMSWEIARTSVRSHTYGEGMRKFDAYIKWEGETIRKPPHSSYIQIAADLGYPGLAIFLGILSASLISLWRIQGTTQVGEASRRMLFSVLLAYLVSSWMIQRPYHAEVFTMVAAISAYHHLEMERRRAASRAPALIIPQSFQPALSRHPRLAEVVLAILMFQGVLLTWDYVLANF